MRPEAARCLQMLPGQAGDQGSGVEIAVAGEVDVPELPPTGEGEDTGSFFSGRGEVSWLCVAHERFREAALRLSDVRDAPARPCARRQCHVAAARRAHDSSAHAQTERLQPGPQALAPRLLATGLACGSQGDLECVRRVYG